MQPPEQIDDHLTELIHVLQQHAPIDAASPTEVQSLLEDLWAAARATNAPLPPLLHFCSGKLLLQRKHSTAEASYRLVIYQATHYLDGAGLIGTIYNSRGERIWMTNFIHSRVYSYPALLPILKLLTDQLRTE